MPPLAVIRLQQTADTNLSPSPLYLAECYDFLPASHMSASHQSPSVRLTYVRLPSAIPTHIYIGLPVATTPDSSSLSFVFPLLSFHRLSYHYSPRSTFQCLAQCFDPDTVCLVAVIGVSIPQTRYSRWRRIRVSDRTYVWYTTRASVRRCAKVNAEPSQQ